MPKINFTNEFHQYNDLPYQSPGNQYQFMANIRYLEQKIAATTREITHWDLYRISSILTDSNAFQSAINDLLPYSSLIVNTKGSTGKEGGDYSPGDIFIKHNDGTYTKIKAERGGIFYPNKITRTTNGSSNYTYNISYQYAANTPPDDKADSGEPTEGQTEFNCDYANIMEYIGITGGLVGSPYNKVYTGTLTSSVTLEFPLNPDYDSTKDPIEKKRLEVEPIIKCFTETNNQLEEVYCDISIVSDTTNQEYTITFVDSSATNLITRVVVK